jgi:amino acid adenylation domain-containing protein
VLIGALYVYFTRTEQRDDFCIGLPVLNRANARAKQTAGLFVGVSPCWFNFGKELSFAELLQQIGKILKAHYRHQRLPVSEVNRQLSLGPQQLFNITLSYENHEYAAEFGNVESHTTLLLHSWEQTPLTIFVRDFHSQADVKLDFVFNRAYFNAEEIRALQTRFVTLLEAVLEQDQVALHQLPIMTSTEQQQLQAWNATDTAYPQDQTIVSLFEAQVARTPANTAVVFEDQSLTYAALNARANQLAHVLIQHGVVADTLVGICVERSLEMVIGLLAILKAGGAYVPLDPSYPAERLAFMVQDSQVALLLTQSHLQDRLPLADLNPQPLLLCVDDPHLAAGQPVDNPPPRSQPQDLAYVIYTSGSTGKPKGVQINHTSLQNHMQWIQGEFDFSVDERLLQKTAVSFDASVWEFYAPLLSGGILVLATPLPTFDIDVLLVNIVLHKITALQVVPSLLQTLLTLETFKEHTHIKHVFCGGEVLPAELKQQFYQLFPHAILCNLYGPTEATIDASFSRCIPDAGVSIGSPIANTRIHLLDAHLHPQPPYAPT